MSEDYRGDELVATAYARSYNRWIMQFLRPHLGRVVVEVGAGRGSFTRELLGSEPERMIAVEPSGFLFPELERELAELPNVELHRGTLATVQSQLADSADSVVYVNVLEHIDDHAQEIRSAAAVLKSGGRLCIFVPALPWLASRFDREIGHYRRYRRHELIELLKENGMTVLYARYFDMLGIAVWFVAMRLLGMRMGSGRVRFYDSVVVPAARVLDRIFGPPAGKSLIAIARKD